MKIGLKNKFMLLVVAGVASTQMAFAEGTANYFRAWQGFQRPDLTCEQFVSALPPFMAETVDLYQGRGLVNYIVVMPPAQRPSYIPDELALVALTSKEDYDRVRATPEGKRYAARHWDYFDKETSKSAPLQGYAEEEPLQSNTAYDMIGESINWAEGYNAVFIGTRKSGQDSSEFLMNLKLHVELAKAVMVPKGLRGYIIIANDRYEVAYLNWESKEAHDLAAQSPEGQEVFADARDFMNILMYEEAVPFRAGNPIEPGKAYSTLQ